MDNTASIDVTFTCQMLSKSNDRQQIVESLQRSPHFVDVCVQLETISHMFQQLTLTVPAYELEEGRRLRMKERTEQLKPIQFGNVIHMPFVKTQPPMYIVLREASAEHMKDIQLQLFALIELCALEEKNCIILAGDAEPILFEKGVMNYDSFMRFMALHEVTHMYPFERLVQQSIAAPFVAGSDVVIVDFNEESLRLNDTELELFFELKQVFDCSVKALVAAGFDDEQLETLLDEVYIKMN